MMVYTYVYSRVIVGFPSNTFAYFALIHENCTYTHEVHTHTPLLPSPPIEEYKYDSVTFFLSSLSLSF